MTHALVGKENQYIIELESRGSFCDGFKIAKGPYEGSLELQRFLNDHDIHCRLPHNHPSKGFKFV